MKVKKTLYNPASGTKVAFGIRLGWHGNAKFDGLECLSGQTAIFDVNKSWVDSFKLHFGVTVDPLKYSVQRLWRDTCRLKHDLREPIRVMMKDFVKVQSSFVINIVEHNKTFQASRIQDCSKYSENIQKTATTPNESTMSPQPFTEEVGMRNQVYNSEITKGHDGTGTTITSTRPTHLSTSTCNHHRISTQVEYNLSVEQPSSSSVSHMDNPRVPPTIIRIRQPKLQSQPVKLAYHQVSKFKGTSKISKTKATSAISYQDNSLYHGGDNYDGRSDVTRLSEDSQMEDLRELGIPYEDLKSMVCRKVHKNYSNIQFLKVKQEMQQFRKNNERAWVRWTTTAPITTNILRELLAIDKK